MKSYSYYHLQPTSIIGSAKYATLFGAQVQIFCYSFLKFKGQNFCAFRSFHAIIDA